MVRQAAADPFIPSISSVPRTYTDDAGRAFIERQHARDAEGDGYSFVIAPEAAPRVGHRVHRPVAAGDRERARLHRLLARRRRPGTRPGRARAAGRGRRSPSATLAIPRLHLFVEPWNVASARTAEAAGFSREATLRGWERIDGEQHDADCFAFLYSEWASRRPDGTPVRRPLRDCPGVRARPRGRGDRRAHRPPDGRRVRRPTTTSAWTP